MGQQSIASAYEGLIHEYNPSIIILCGIAGSIRDTVNIGDVVIADDVIYYDMRSEQNDVEYRRLRSYRIEPWLDVLINSIYDEFGEHWINNNSLNKENGNIVKVFKGPIGTGGAVIRCDDSKIKKWLKTVHEKCIAVETEAGSASHLFWEGRLKFSNKAVGLLVVRGISDKSDVKKNDDYRIIAADNAAKVVEEIVRRIPIDVSINVPK